MTYLRVISHVADMRNSKHCRDSLCKRVVSLHRFENISCRNGFRKTNGLVTGGFAKQRIVFWGVGLGQGPGRAKKADAYCSKHMLASLSGLLLDSHVLVFFWCFATSQILCQRNETMR